MNKRGVYLQSSFFLTSHKVQTRKRTVETWTETLVMCHRGYMACSEEAVHMQFIHFPFWKQMEGLCSITSSITVSAESSVYVTCRSTWNDCIRSYVVRTAYSASAGSADSTHSCSLQRDSPNSIFHLFDCIGPCGPVAFFNWTVF